MALSTFRSSRLLLLPLLLASVDKAFRVLGRLRTSTTLTTLTTLYGSRLDLNARVLVLQIVFHLLWAQNLCLCANGEHSGKPYTVQHLACIENDGARWN